MWDKAGGRRLIAQGSEEIEGFEPLEHEKDVLFEPLYVPLNKFRFLQKRR